MKSYLSKRNNGIWYVILRYTDINGKQKNKWVSTRETQKSEAAYHLQDIQKKYSYLEYGELDQKIEVSTYFANWKERQQDKVCMSTFESYETYFDKHIVPYFSNQKVLLRNLTSKQINDYIGFLQHRGRLKGSGGLSLSMVRKIFSLMKKALDDAVIEGYIEHNPALPIRIREVRGEGKHQTKYFLHDVSECQAVLDAFQGHYLQPIVYITLYYGLRRSEVLGLKWGAVDFENKTITIQHTVVKSKTVIAKDQTKTQNSRATMRMLPEIEKMLLNIREKQKSNKAFFGLYYVDNDYVFTKENGEMYYPDVITRSFQRVLKANNLPRMRFHDLRGSTASWLFNRGWGINEVREWLRHADIETTANIYTQISKEKVKLLADDISNSLKI